MHIAFDTFLFWMGKTIWQNWSLAAACARTHTHTQRTSTTTQIHRTMAVMKCFIMKNMKRCKCACVRCVLCAVRAASCASIYSHMIEVCWFLLNEQPIKIKTKTERRQRRQEQQQQLRLERCWRKRTRTDYGMRFKCTVFSARTAKSENVLPFLSRHGRFVCVLTFKK